MISSSSQHHHGLSIKISKDLQEALNSNKLATSNFYENVELIPLKRRHLKEANDAKDTAQKSCVKDEDIADEKKGGKLPPLSIISFENTNDDDTTNHFVTTEDEDEGGDTDEEKSNNNNSDFDNDTAVALLSADKSQPIVVVNLERLCGYVPKSGTERDAILEQVHQALGSEDEFEQRVVELFEMKLAQHADTTEIDNIQDKNQLFVVDYPEFLFPADGRVLSTERLWKKIRMACHQTKIGVVRRILSHLCKCSRSLVWKFDMQEELIVLAEQELSFKRSLELDQWRSIGRKQQLDKLYQVRETFSYRLEMARLKEEELEEELEKKVQEELARCSGLQALDLESNTIFAVDESVDPSTLLGITEESNNDDDILFLKEDEDDDISSNDSGDGHHHVNALHEESLQDDSVKNTTGKVHSTRRRRKRIIQQHRERLQLASAEALEKKKIEDAQQEEDRIRQRLISNSKELLMASAAVKSFETQMEKVDDLLESLQDEEWADEEEGFTALTLAKAASSNLENDKKKESLTLLDQILAMILGAIHDAEDNDNSKDFFIWVRKEHTEIVEQWFKFFGRMPPSVSTETTNTISEAEEQTTTDQAKLKHHSLKPSELRAELGIDDVECNWDENEDEENMKPASTGLRPGGSLRPGGKFN